MFCGLLQFKESIISKLSSPGTMEHTGGGGGRRAFFLIDGVIVVGGFGWWKDLFEEFETLRTMSQT